MDRTIDFVRGKTGKCLAYIALPLLAAMVLNMAYNLVDSLWIGNLLGEEAMAALTSATPILLIFNSFAMGAGNGISILVSHAVGARDKARQKSLVATALAISLSVVVVLTIAIEIFLPTALTALGTPATTFAMAQDYLTIYMISFPIAYLYCYFSSVLRSFGNSAFQAAAMLGTTILNAAIDPLFISLFGFTGAAWATLLSQTACLVLAFVYLRRKQIISISIKDFKPTEIMPYIKAATPAIIQQALPAISTMALTAAVSVFGISAIAAFGIARNLEILLFYPAIVLNMALTTIVGQCLGAKRPDRAKDYVKTALLFGGILITLVTVVIVAFSSQISGFFIRSDEAAMIVAGYFSVIGIGYVLNTVTSCFLGALNGLGHPGTGMGVMVLYYLIVRIPLAYLLGFGMDAGLTGIWVAVLISHAIAAVVSGAIVVRQFRRRRQKNASISMIRRHARQHL